MPYPQVNREVLTQHGSEGDTTELIAKMAATLDQNRRCGGVSLAAGGGASGQLNYKALSGSTLRQTL
jgi:hypothetical protein